MGEGISDVVEGLRAGHEVHYLPSQLKDLNAWLFLFEKVFEIGNAFPGDLAIVVYVEAVGLDDDAVDPGDAFEFLVDVCVFANVDYVLVGVGEAVEFDRGKFDFV